MARGDFENLPGQGKPLPEEDLSHIPEEMRMAYRVLKNAGYVPEEIANRKEISQLTDLLENGTDEKNRLKSMRRLRVLMDRLGSERHASLAAHDEYYQKPWLYWKKKKERPGQSSQELTSHQQYGHSLRFNISITQRIMNMEQLKGFIATGSIDLALPAPGCYLRAIFSRYGMKIPIKQNQRTSATHQKALACRKSAVSDRGTCLVAP